jgi:glutamine amidotransferase
MISIVDYGLGNILAFVNMGKRIGVDIAVAKTAADLASSSRIILPGVGSFDHAMALLDRSGMRGALEELVVGNKVPVLGVCVGMQILAERSDEGRARGLGWIPGEVLALRSLLAGQDQLLPLPHMGWNDVCPSNGWDLCRGLEGDARFYFLHSFYYQCADSAHVAATCYYGTEFACAVRHGNIQGVQFHPEKSHHFGAGLIKNFARA